MHARRLLAGLVSTLLLGTGLAVLPATGALADSAPLDPADPATPVTVTADPLPTVQINGVAWSQVVVGDVVYVAGRFTTARPAGAPAGVNEVPRDNVLAYDVRTGALITSFAPSLNGQALSIAASPDGSRIYVGGDFTQVNGQPRSRIAALTPAGALVATWRPAVQGQVRAIAATNDFVYFGGNVTAVGAVSRTRLAVVTAVDGSLTTWAPVPGYGSTAGNTDGNRTLTNEVLSMVLTNGNTQLVVAGRFDTMNGVRATGVAAVDAFTSVTRPFAINQQLTNQGVNSAIWSLSTDGTAVYGTGYNFFGPGNLEGSFAAEVTGGRVRWINDCWGDSYATHPMGGVLYQANHAHDCDDIGSFPEQTERVWKRATALSTAATGIVGNLHHPTWQRQPAPTVLPWFPTMAAGTATGQAQAGWSVSGNGRYVVYGGEFPTVNGVAQQGLVRYALPSIAPNRVGPDVSGSTPTAAVLGAGTVRVAWRAASDPDNEHLTYRVYRDGGTTPVATLTRPSQWWDRPVLGWTDTGLTAGAHSYRVTVADPAGTTVSLPQVAVQVPAAGTSARAYSSAVQADGATSYWPLGEGSGATGFDRAGGNDLQAFAGVTRGPGAVAGDPDGAVRLNGTTAGYLATTTPTSAPQTFSAEFWFSTTTTAGGRFLGFGNLRTGSSVHHDRLVYMDAAGRLNFGVWPLETKLLTTPTAYNDGRWHHVVASLGRTGMQLFVDGRLVASRADGTRGQHNHGYWRVGGDRTWAGAEYVNAQVDEVALYPAVLSADKVANHFTLGTTGRPTDTAPTASFTTTSRDLTVAVDGSGSTDTGGRVTAHAWNWGDGTPAGSGATATHTYAAAGTHTVTLTVTDDGGRTGTTSRQVTVTAPPANRPPAAAFTVATSGTTVAVDGRGSVDTDGSVTSYAWSFGDGGTATGATAPHTYAAAGTYTVTLTVTDDDGATGSSAQQVTVTAPPVGALARDAFNRTTTGGWGTADLGGAWTATAGAARLSVRPGTGELALPAAGNNTGALLGGVSTTSADVRTSFALSSMPTGAGTYVYVTGRRVSAGTEYRVLVRVAADGRVSLTLSRLAGGVEGWPGGEVVVPGLTYTPGMRLEVRVRVSGAGSTDVAAAVWAAGTAEPTTPQLVRADATAALQAPGAVGIAAYRPASATAATAVRVSGFEVTAGR
ncbi:PKD repeat-containing protein [Geodermatophilus siccatus]|uniref:PKD repeat-containing protein n=1 Tax=Geodermatophilus siccatus TaxID=1137991 RepID=A0A1G9UX20_9ACTN|nr:PKD repeat-containing protein [Geodermatophilus siccatus]